MHVLLIEDNIDHVDIISATLYHAYGPETQIEPVRTFADGIDKLSESDFDIALLDLALPDSTLQETVSRIRLFNTNTPIVVLTSMSDVEIAEDLVHNGVQDYVPKSEVTPELLKRICNHARVRKAQQIQLEQNIRDMDAFCQILSHDFRSPVGQIRNLVELLRKELAQKNLIGDEEEEQFRLIQKSTSTILDLVQGLQGYISLGHADETWGEVDLGKLIDSVHSHISENYERDFVLNKCSLPVVLGNESQLFHCFQNIITNGLKYNDSESKIISIECTSSIVAHKISIADNGIGIPGENIKSIFEPFQRLHRQGTYSGSGLGLSIVKRILELHNSKVDVVSTPGEGSTFTLTFPVAAN